MGKKRQAKWHSEHEQPKRTGWYLCDAVDGRWGGKLKYRAWGRGMWWIPLVDGWISSDMGIYKWQGPPIDVNGPSPHGDNPCVVPRVPVGEYARG